MTIWHKNLGHGILAGLWMGLRSLLGDRRGATTIYVAFAGVLALSGGVLALDIGRVVVLRSQMQNAADAAALSAAAAIAHAPRQLLPQPRQQPLHAVPSGRWTPGTGE